MLNQAIAFSLRNRTMIAIVALILFAYGGYLTVQSRIDVLPDLNRPTVTIMTEAPGLAPEEVEILVTFPIESALNGATDVRRVRSASGIGLSIVWVEFEWGSDIFIDRQIVTERLQLAREQLPEGTEPVMAPISSIMGEIMLVGLTSRDGATSPMDVRTAAEWIIRPQLLSIQGISQVSVMGGGVKQYQVLTRPGRLAQYDVTLDELVHAVDAANVSAGAGFVLRPVTEELIRVVGRVQSIEELENAVVKPGNPAPVLVKHVADVRFGRPIMRGDGAVNGKPAVILAIQKQPNADTLELTRRIDDTLSSLKRLLPEDVVIHGVIFRQQEFIEAAVSNVIEALRDGAILVIIVLFLFLWNFRTSVITLTAIPLSIIITALVFRAFGMSINTMSLGGIAVAIGELVDDSIVDIENIFRRMKENRLRPPETREPFLVVVYRASVEVRNPIVYATLIVAIVVVPLLHLGGIEGRMFAPIAISYITSLMASLLVSLSVTPVLASFLLPRAKVIARENDAWLLRLLKRGNERILRVVLDKPTAFLSGFVVLLAAAGAAYTQMGGEFLPPFNEGTFTVNVVSAPGTSLEESNRLGRAAEALLARVPEVESTARRTGRAELDEHAEGVNYSEIDVRLKAEGRSRETVMEDIRDKLAHIPGALVNVGQPIGHRIDHLLSGIRAQIAVKIFGADLEILRTKAQEFHDLIAKVGGVVDLQVEQQVETPQVRISFRNDALQRYGLQKKEVAEALETALRGTVVSQVLEEQRMFDLVVWYDEEARKDPEVIRHTLIRTPSGARVPLSTFADTVEGTGPNTINRENVLRRIVVSCNVAGRDLAGVIEDIRGLEPKLGLSGDYFVQYGGQFEAQQQATRQLYLLSAFAILGVFVLLIKALGSWRSALLCMFNLPLAFVGGVLAIYLFGGGVLSVASLVGFMTLTGIVMRNGILLLDHYKHLLAFEGESFGKEMIIRGTLERLAPVAMTAVTTILGLLPLALGAGQTGKEILHPLAITVIGGLITATVLVQILLPALYIRFGRASSGGPVEDQVSESETAPPADLAALARRLEAKGEAPTGGS